MKTSIKPYYDIAIAGAGPVGATAALLAAGQGLSCVLFEGKAEPGIHPAAHVINARTMEVWRGIDSELESEIRNTSVDPFELRNILWCTSLAGRELGRINIVGEDPESALRFMTSSPTRPVHFSQNKLEPVLWRKIREVGEGIDFFTGTRVSTIKDNGKQGVRLAIEGSGAGEEVRCRYLIAADGARSRIRKELGIHMDGPVMQNVISIYFKANLDRFVRTKPAILHWTLNSEVAGVFVCHDHRSHEWVFMLPYLPPQRPEDFDEQRCLNALYAAIGSRAVQIEMLSIGSWAMTAQVAESYRKDSIFLAGDSAHRFPPTGGYGLNTGVQDVHNLIWKMGGVLTGAYPESILATYESERMPVAVSNCDFSVDNNTKMSEINKAVGLNPNQQQLVRALFKVPPLAWLSPDAKSATVDHMVGAALSGLKTLDADTAAGRRMRDKVAGLIPLQKKHFISLGQDLGFAYQSELIESEAGPQPTADNPVIEYRPTTWPGARVPHFWIERNPQRPDSDLEERRLSVLDLIDGKHWLIACASPESPWLDQFAELVEQQAGYQRLCRVVTIGVAGQCEYLDPSGGFTGVWELLPGGVLLIRPDGHVAWRSTGLPEGKGILANVIKRIIPLGDRKTMKTAEAV